MSRTRSARDDAFAPARLVIGAPLEALQRILAAHDVLRRSLPYLVTAFIALAGLGAAFQLLESRHEILSAARDQLGLLADLTAERLAQAKLQPGTNWQPDLEAALPKGASFEGRSIFLADSDGDIRARAPASREDSTTLLAVLGPEQALTTFGASAGVARLSLPGGGDALVTVRNFGAAQNQIAFVQPIVDALSDWRQSSHIEITVLACGALILLLLAAALWAPPEPRTKAGDAMALGADADDAAAGASLGEIATDANARLRDAVETISEAFVLWDDHNRLVMCNSKYQQFHGLPDAAVRQGTPYEEVIAAAVEPVVRNRIAVDQHHNGSRTYEALLEDGRWLHINEGRTRDGGYVSVGTDVTQLKQSQRLLADNEARLRTSVSELNLSRRELEQQKQQLVDLAEKYALEKNRAEAANRAKSEFLANISHELRTPLNAVIGFSEVMQSGLFGPLGHAKYQEYARDIFESGNFLLEVINDILDMSKIEAGRLALEVERVDVADIVKESMKVVAKAAEERQIALTRHGPDNFYIEADRRALKQVFLNLLSNAVKFSRDGGGIEVRLSRSQGKARIAIRDTGIGIPEADIAKLGRPFEQVENQFSKSHQGSGLGLAISRALVELHGGTLGISSQEGEGTTVTCLLPMKAIAQPERCLESEAV
jgi:PAS domain S-box-containing protein